MTRHDEALLLAENLLADAELAQTSTSRRAMKAMRLARLTSNAGAQAWLEFELAGVPRSGAGAAWMDTTKRWTDRAKDEGYRTSVSGIEASKEALEAALRGHSVQVSLSGDYVALAMNNRASQINSISGQLIHLGRILGAIDAQIYAFASESYAELKFSDLQGSLFEQSQEAIDEQLSGMSGGALRMVDSLGERLGSDDPVAISQAMTTCRQLIDAVADHVFPGQPDPYRIEGRPEMDVRRDKVKNRLNAYIHSRGIVGGRAARLGTTINHAYDRISAAVHTSGAVNGHEARFLFIGTYALLGEVLTLRIGESPEQGDPSYPGEPSTTGG